jgi:hypothetical protein
MLIDPTGHALLDSTGRRINGLARPSPGQFCAAGDLPSRPFPQNHPSLEPKPEPLLDPELDPDSLEMLDPDPDSMNPDLQLRNQGFDE